MTATPASGADPGPGPDPGAGRARLRAALRPRLGWGQLAAAALCGVLGFAIAVQVRATEDAGLSGLRETDLVRILDDVTERSARLRTEALELEETRDRVTGGGDVTRAALVAARERTEVLGILAGTLPATGEGVELTISDPSGKVRSDVLLDALQELRDAGGEAFQLSTIGGPAVRVVASTALVDVDGGVSVDGTALRSPYRFVVIGDSRTMAAAMDIPGGVLDVLRQRDARGVVSTRSEVSITALRAARPPRYARPAGEPPAR